MKIVVYGATRSLKDIPLVVSTGLQELIMNCQSFLI